MYTTTSKELHHWSKESTKINKRSKWNTERTFWESKKKTDQQFQQENWVKGTPGTHPKSTLWSQTQQYENCTKLTPDWQVYLSEAKHNNMRVALN